MRETQPYRLLDIDGRTLFEKRKGYSRILIDEVHGYLMRDPMVDMLIDTEGSQDFGRSEFIDQSMEPRHHVPDGIQVHGLA